MSLPLVSVIIPARNESRRIGDCLGALREFMPVHVSHEVLVGDHSSTDDTADIARSKGATVVTLAGGTVGELRNTLVARSHGAVLIFIDADVTVTREWGQHISEVMQQLTQTDLQVTGSLCRVPRSTNPFIQSWFALLRQGHSNYLGTGHLIVGRRLFELLQGFTPGLRTGEDYDFCMRAQAAGAQLVIRPELEVIHHDYPLTAADFIRRERWHGAGDVQSLRRLLHSKVALASLIFVVAHLALIVSLALWALGAVLPLLVIAGLLLLMSYSKFSGLQFGQRLTNLGICYLYLVGRSLALLAAAKPAESW